jgi:hypothetical protein
VVALHPRVGAQRLEQRDQRAARAVLVLSHGDATGERVRFFSRSFSAIAISRAPTRSNAGGQRDTRAIARLDAGVRCARVQSRIEIDRRRRVEGAPPSVEEAVVLVGDTFWKPSRKRLKALPNQFLQTKFWELSKRKAKATTLVFRGYESTSRRAGGASRVRIVGDGTKAEAVLAREGEAPVRSVQPVPAWQGEEELRGLQRLPARQAETQLRGLQPVPAQQAETLLRGLQRLPARQAERSLRGLQPLPAWQAEKRLRGLQPLPAWEGETLLHGMQWV